MKPTSTISHLEHPLEGRLRWLLWGRLSIAFFCLFALGFWPLEDTPLGDNTLACQLVFLFAGAVNAVYFVLARYRVSYRALAVVQIFIDIVIVGALVYLSGINRFFALLYFATVISSAMVLGPRMALVCAFSASIVLGGISVAYYLSAHPHFQLELPFVGHQNEAQLNLNFHLPYLLFFALSLHLVALLAGKLSEEVSRIRIFNEEILQNVAGGVLAADRFGELQFMNLQGARLLGVPDPDRARGQQISDVLPKPVAQVLRQAMEARGRVGRELSVAGTPVAIVASCVTSGQDGPLRGVVAIVNDLSMREKMERMTRRAERFQALLQMSAGMAHEIRNPLASIRGAAQELSGTTEKDEDGRRLLGIVVHESDRLERIIRDFLDFASDRPVERSLINAADLLRETAALVEARGDLGRVTLVREFPEKLPCHGAADRLKQVFLNLALNAVDALGGNGTADPKVVLRGNVARGFEGDPREGVLVEVEDNGPGMEPDAQARAFDPFFTTKSNGTGMGLSIARRIVQGHGGDILLESEPGQGTCVKVWIPS